MGDNSLAAVSPMASFVYALFLSALVAVSALPVDPNENPDGLSKHIADTLKGYSSQLGELKQTDDQIKQETAQKIQAAEDRAKQSEDKARDSEAKAQQEVQKMQDDFRKQEETMK